MTFSADSSAMVLFFFLVDLRVGFLASWQGMRDALLMRPHGSACWWLAGILRKGTHRSLWKQMRVWAAFVAAALCIISINDMLVIHPPIHSFIQKIFIII